jgi:hypothetical protein
MSPVLASDPPRARTTRLLSEELAELRRTFADRPATLAEVIVALGGRAYALLMILFALPFSVPVSVPGSSTPLGIAIAIIAVQLAFGRLPWLPRRALTWKLPPGFFSRVVDVTERVVRQLEGFLHPRWPALTNASWMRAAHLLTLVVAALLLALPIIVPLTNTFPGWAILLLACGLLERDGAFIVAGYVVFFATLIYFTLVGSAIVAALAPALRWLTE